MLQIIDNTLLSSKDVAKKLGISYDLLRKYNTVFYEVGHTFPKEKNQVMYRSVDILMLQEFLKLRAQTKHSVKECAEIVVNGKTSSQGNQSSQQLIKDLAKEPIIQNTLERIEQLEQHKKQYEEQLETMKKYIDTKLEERDRQLMELVRDTQETKKMIAAAKEKKWWQFWK